MLREKIRALEMRLMEMMRHGTENDVLHERLQRWIKAVMCAHELADLPGVIVNELMHEFMVPQVAIKLWNVRPEFAKQDFAKDVSDEAKALAAQLHAPYVGVRAHEEVLSWLPEAQTVQSMALIPLYHVTQETASSEADPSPASVTGLLVLASPDAQRYHEGMGVDLLDRLGALASAAVTRLT
jgi:uncharacterized protein YigA (DUF484 family)